MRVALVAVLCLLPSAMFSQAAKPPAAVERLDRMLGGWTGTGVLMQQPARFDLRLARVLGDRFVRLDYRVSNPAGATLFAATAFHGRENGSAAWFDSRGARLDIANSAVGDTLRARWTNQSETGSTDYVMTGDSVHVRDFVVAGGAPQQFARASYGRGSAACGSLSPR
jgi:hypothetical protein